MLNIGSVIRIKVEDTNPPKIKWFIIVGEVDQHYAIVYINTDPRYISPTNELQGLQFSLTERECPFLDHDSFVDCSDLREKEKVKVDRFVSKEKGCFRGIVSAPQLKMILSLIIRARTISPVLRKKYGITF